MSMLDQKSEESAGGGSASNGMSGMMNSSQMFLFNIEAFVSLCVHVMTSVNQFLEVAEKKTRNNEQTIRGKESTGNHHSAVEVFIV